VDASLEIYHGEKGLPGASAGVPGPYGLGQRVPMIVVSPWSKGGFVSSEVFDHTSIIRFMERRFGVTEPNISPWRRAVCGDLTGAFDFASVDDDAPALPSTASYRPPDHQRHPGVTPVPPAAQSVPKQEPGVRRARPLPYDLDAVATVGAQGLTITFANHGAAGAVFHTRARTAGSSAQMQAKMFTVEAGRRLDATFPVSGGYDVEVHGPNGFYRRFAAGTAVPGLEVVARRPGDSEEIQFVVTNAGAPVDVTITDAYGHGRPVTKQIRSGGRVEYSVGGDAHGWYDVTVTSSGDAHFVRGLAGHVENGRPSVTDPALGR
jgi:phospholipase C